MMRIIGLLTILIILILSPVSAITITDNNNTISNNDYPVVAINEVVGFNVTLDVPATLHTWYVDGVDQSNNYTNFSTSFTTRGYKNVTIVVTNVTTDTLTYGVIVKRDSATAGNTITAMNNSGYTDFLNALDSENLFDFLRAFIQPELNVIGSVFYLIIYGLPLVMIWIRQEKPTSPIVLIIIFGVVMFAFIPSQWIAPMVILTVLSISSLIYMNFKER